jgi:CBS domain-containing protein
MRVKEIAKKALTIDKGITLGAAAKIMAAERMGCLIVVGTDSVAGIITERDVLKQVSKDVASLGRPVKEFMSAKVITIDYDRHIDDAAVIMKKKHIKKLPVMKKGKLVGIITSTDLVANADDFNDSSFF